MNELATIQFSPRLVSIQKKIEEAVKESQAVLIFDQSDVDKAGFYIKKFRQLKKSAEDYRKEQVQPLNDTVKEINNFFKDFISSVIIEEKRLTNEVDEFLIEKRKRDEEQRLKEQKEMEDSIIEEAELFNDESVLDNIPQIEIKQEKLKDISSNITTVRKKTWRVINIDKIPYEYIQVNEKKMDELRAKYDFEDKSPIPGIEFEFIENIRMK